MAATVMPCSSGAGPAGAVSEGPVVVSLIYQDPESVLLPGPDQDTITFNPGEQSKTFILRTQGPRRGPDDPLSADAAVCAEANGRFQQGEIFTLERGIF